MYYLCTANERIASWCNGSTTDFGSACRGSNPREATIPLTKRLTYKVNLFFYAGIAFVLRTHLIPAYLKNHPCGCSNTKEVIIIR